MKPLSLISQKIFWPCKEFLSTQFHSIRKKNVLNFRIKIGGHWDLFKRSTFFVQTFKGKNTSIIVAKICSFHIFLFSPSWENKLLKFFSFFFVSMISKEWTSVEMQTLTTFFLTLHLQRAFHRFGKAKFSDGGLALGSS